MRSDNDKCEPDDIVQKYDDARMNLVMTIGYMQLMQDFVMTLLNSTCKSA